MNNDIKLVTFQSMGAVKDLFNKGYLECDENKIDTKKVGIIYNWIVNKMNQNIANPYNTKYPLWCFVKCYNGICPPKRKGKKIEGFDVKITFKKIKKDVFITDFIRYSFLLNNQYIPNSLKDKETFDKELKKYNITLEDLKAFVRRDKYEKCRDDLDFLKICNKIEDSFDRCITEDSDILQGCIWRINLDEIEKIEILNDCEYMFGSLNYVRSNGKRIDWIKEYYKKL